MYNSGSMEDLSVETEMTHEKCLTFPLKFPWTFH